MTSVVDVGREGGAPVRGFFGPLRFLSAIGCAALLAATPAAAGGHGGKKLIGTITKNVELGYTVFGIGFAVLSADFRIQLSRSRYKVVSRIKTEGIAGLILQSRWDVVSEGRITPSGLTPIRYRSDISTNQGRGAVSVTRKGGKYLISAVPKVRADRRPLLAKKLRPNFPDPLSALISVSMYNTRPPCTGRQRVFDGRQIFDLSFKFEAAVTIKEGAQYSGPAYRCRVKHTPIAGQSSAELSQEARSPSPYHVLWLAEVDLTENGPKILIPVRISLNSGWGSTTVRLTRSSIGGKPLAVASATRKTRSTSKK